MPSVAPPPSGAACAFPCRGVQTSLRGSVGCEARSCAFWLPLGLSDCPSLRPGRGSAAAFPSAQAVRPQWLRWWLAAASCRARWPRRSPPPRHRPPRRRSGCAWCLFCGQNTSKISLLRSHRASGISQITPNGFRFRVCLLRRVAILGSFPEKTTMPELVSTPNPRFAETSVFG